MTAPDSTESAPASAPSRPTRVEPVALGTLRWAVESAGTVRIDGPSDVELTGVCLRSQDVQPGDLYAALPGARTHGAHFTRQARERGAVAVLTDAQGAPAAADEGLPALVVASPRAVLGSVSAVVYGRPAEAFALVGVTGTQGKTTTTQLLYGTLRAAGRRAAVVGTMGTWIDGLRVKTSLTTPEAPDLHAMFAVMREAGVEVCVMEVSSHALVLNRVDGVVFDLSVFLNFGRDHLDFHHDVESYFAAKASLFGAERSRRALVNVDDPTLAAWLPRVQIPARTYASNGADADWTATDTTSDGRGSSFTLVAPDGIRHQTAVAMPGSFNVSNALACLAAASEVGVDVDAACAGLASTGGVAGRLERVEAGQSFDVVVDYAHKPDAVRAVLAALRPLTDERLWVVIGAGGDRDAGKRELMGAAAAELADVVVVTDDNPRREDPAEIRAALVAGARGVGSEPPATGRRRPPAQIVEIGDRRRAIGFALEGAGDRDIVVIAGKGHETGQEVEDRVVPFDDRSVAVELLLARARAGGVS